MALRVMRLVIPAGTTAFGAANAAHKVRAEPTRSRSLCGGGTMLIHKDKLT